MENYTAARVKSANTLQDLIGGLTFVSVEHDKQQEKIVFQMADGWRFELYHEQECCETVWLEDINGDLNDLVGTPIIVAEKRSRFDEDSEDDSKTWTFFCFRTTKGTVDVSFAGTSNGCYRVDADMCVSHPEKYPNEYGYMTRIDSILA